MTAATAPPRRLTLPEAEPLRRWLWIHQPGNRGVCGTTMLPARARQLIAAGYVLRTGRETTSPRVDPR